MSSRFSLLRATMAGLALGLIAAAPGPDKPPSHSGPIRAVAARDGHAIPGGFEGTAILWPEGQVLASTGGAIEAVALAPDGRAITGDAEGHVLAWRNGTAATVTTHSGRIAGLAVSGDSIGSASWDGTARITAPDGAVRILEGHDGPVNAIAFAQDGTPVTTGYDGTVRRWAAAGTDVIHLAIPQNAVAVAPDGEIATAGADGVLRLISPSGQREIQIDTVPLTSLAVSPDGSGIAVASLGGTAVVIDRQALRVVTVFLGTEHPLWSIAWSGPAVLTGGAGRVVRRWDAATGRPLGFYGAAPADPPLPSGTRGAQVFRACSACHSLADDGVARAGPSLHDVFGRPAGTRPGYAYSPALRNTAIVWTPATVADLFTRGPQAVVPGTRMPEQRILSPEDLQALLQILAP